MEAVMCNIVKKDLSRVSLPCYLYTIHGVTVALHTVLDESSGFKFSCSEYRTGYRIASGMTMQEALDESTHRLWLQTITLEERIQERLKETGYANAPVAGG